MAVCHFHELHCTCRLLFFVFPFSFPSSVRMLKILRLAIYCVASECLVTTNSGWWPPLICVDPRHSVAWMNASLPHLPPWPYFFAAHIEITNHVVLGLPSLIHHHHLCVSLIWSPSVSEGRQGACWSGHDPEQPERPHGDPEHLPTAEEPQRTGEKPVWAWQKNCIFTFYHINLNPLNLVTNLLIWSSTSFT